MSHVLGIVRPSRIGIEGLLFDPCAMSMSAAMSISILKANARMLGARLPAKNRAALLTPPAQ